MGAGELIDMLWMGPAAALALGYLLGAIPFGLLLGRMAGIGDIRQAGSGNIGATNVLRVGGKGLAAATLLLDAGKGAVAVLLGALILPESGALLGAAGAFFGHLYPVWLRFRGGKGVATLLGITLALYWPVGLIFAAVWLGALVLFRYSSVGGMAAAVSAPLAAAIFGRFELALLLIALALMVLWRHRANIERLLAGTEPRIGGARGG
ncbi:glycerol-3-phosphate 1-O-acyltransferase PlsY [Sphingomonas flavalba]|uniref:glycerol-3-phosphate 1-O-acyltransferase PlsY n=1 Tax=Sphingomonas flavalba TaxID=2559804 RepID=UPI0039DF3912